MGWEPGRRREPEPPPAERVLAIFVKAARSVRLVEREHFAGRELRCLMAGETLWTRVIRPGDDTSVEAEVEAARERLLARGWKPAE